MAQGYRSNVECIGLYKLQIEKIKKNKQEKLLIYKQEPTNVRLYLDKVSKGDLKDTEARIMTRIEGMQSDILARMDLLFGKVTKQ